MRCLRLPFTFDPVRLQADLAHVESSEWIPHMQKRHYDGEWSGAALRALGGDGTNIVPEAHNGATFSDTALLRRCPYFQAVLATFRCPLQAVRLLRLHAGSNIAEHIDRALDFDDGEIRIHIPIVTSDAVKFYLDGTRLVMAPGECWYTNVNLPHSVENSGATDRIHLVIDCQVDAWLRDIFARTPRPAGEHYELQLALPQPPPATAMFECFAGYAGSRTKFQIEGRTLVLTWAGAHSWQLRLKLPTGDLNPTPWRAQLESSPDPERTHRADVDALLSRLQSTFAGLTVTPGSAA